MKNNLIIIIVSLFSIYFTSCKKINENSTKNSASIIIKNKRKEKLPKRCNPLIKTYWHQYKPFNKYASEIIKKDNVVAGCAIIALAQLLNYHKHFENGKKYFFGSIGGYLNSMNTNFPNSENKPYISEFIADISKSKYLETYVESNQSIYLYINSIPIFLEKYGYEVSIGNEINFYKIKKYLSEGNPIIVFAKMKNGKKSQTHVWIIDGYVDDGLTNQKLHMNWGFGVNYQNGEYEDGWYELKEFGYVKHRNIFFNENISIYYTSMK